MTRRPGRVCSRVAAQSLRASKPARSRCRPPKLARQTSPSGHPVACHVKDTAFASQSSKLLRLSVHEGRLPVRWAHSGQPPDHTQPTAGAPGWPARQQESLYPRAFATRRRLVSCPSALWACTGAAQPKEFAMCSLPGLLRSARAGGNQSAAETGAAAARGWSCPSSFGLRLSPHLHRPEITL